MLSLIERFWTEDSGQGLTEYALVLALVSVGLIAVLIIFRDAIGGIFPSIPYESNTRHRINWEFEYMVTWCVFRVN